VTREALTVTGYVDASGVAVTTPGGAYRSVMVNNSDNGTFYAVDSGGTQRVLVTSNGSSYFNGGNVGIGSTNPQYTLDVNGPARLGCPSGMVDSGAGFCIDSSDSTESGYGSSFATCADAGKMVCSFREICTAIRRSIGGLGSSYRVSDLMFWTGNNTAYFGGSGGANALNMPAACSSLTAPGPSSGTNFKFRCCRGKG
jgi:hypothetical protein